jgi:DNA-binding CsgD family transcriptional regulator/PAS domain-containing protein
LTAFPASQYLRRIVYRVNIDSGAESAPSTATFADQAQMLGPLVGTAVASEFIELSTVIGDIYDAAIDPMLWQKALASACLFVRGCSAALFWHDSATQRSQALYLFNEDPHFTNLYFEKYLTMNPMFPAASFVDTGTIVSIDDVLPYEEFIETRFYKEWVAPQGVIDALAVNLEKSVTRTSVLNVRTNVMSDDGMRNRMSLLVPHFQRAVAIGRLFDQNETVDGALTQTLNHVEAGVLLVGADGSITFANASAKAMLSEAALIRAENNALRAALPEADRTLRGIFAAAERGDASVGVRGVAVPLTANSHDRWFAHALPLTSGNRQKAATAHAAVAAVFIRQTTPDARAPLEAIAKNHKLTASEVRVLHALLKVNSVKGMAETLGLSQATVKTHLHNLFRKTGTRRQSELVKFVAGI